MMRYNVRLLYHESKPELAGREFEVDYEVEAESEAAALRRALMRFGEYKNFNFASWIRTVIEEGTQVIPEVAGRYLDTCTPAEALTLLSAGGDGGPLPGVVEGIRWIPALRGDPAIVARLFALLDAGALPLRVACVETLRRSGRPEAVERFAAALKGERDHRVRASMVAAVGEHGSAAMLPVILDELSHPDDRVRANAVEAAERLGDATTVERLLSLAEDPSNRVRANVIRAVFRLGKLHRKENLEAMIASPDPRMRASAAWCLGEIPGESTFARLLAMAGDPDPAVRRNVIRGIAKTNTPQALAALCRMLPESDPECAELLDGAILARGDAAEEPLLALLADPLYRDAARAILDRLAAAKLRSGRLVEWLALAFRRRL